MKRWLNGFVISKVIWRQWMLKIIWMQRLVSSFLLTASSSILDIFLKTNQRKWKSHSILWFKNIASKLQFWLLFRSLLKILNKLNRVFDNLFSEHLFKGIDMFINGTLRQCNGWWKYGQVFQCKSHLDLAYFSTWKFIDEKISWATSKFSRQCKTSKICSQKGIGYFKQLLALTTQCIKYITNIIYQFDLWIVTILRVTNFVHKLCCENKQLIEFDRIKSLSIHWANLNLSLN